MDEWSSGSQAAVSLRLPNRAWYENGVVTTGEREIVPQEAEIIRRIFRITLRVCHRGNGEAAQRANAARPTWSALEPEHDSRQSRARHWHSEQRALYRATRVESPAVPEGSGHREACRAPNPPSEWVTNDVPQLRIVDDELWQQCRRDRRVSPHGRTARKQRFNQFTTPEVSLLGSHEVRRVRRRLRHVLARPSGLLRRSRPRHMHQRLTITRQEVEDGSSVPCGQADAEDFFEDFCREVAREPNRLRMEHRAGLSGACASSSGSSETSGSSFRPSRTASRSRI